MAEKPKTIDAIIARMRELQEQLEQEISRKGEEFRYRLENGRVIFDREARRAQARFKVGLWAYLKRTRILFVLSAPFIYALIIPFVLLDLFVSLYQAVCFPVYGIPKVRRGDHIRIDRHHLGYLNGHQKLNCIYCGYCNGLLSWVREIAGRTEAYWCPIKHAARVEGRHGHYPGFLDYGDAEGFEAGLAKARADVMAKVAPPEEPPQAPPSEAKPEKTAPEA